MNTLEKYKKLLNEHKILGGMAALLHQDQETVMPIRSNDFRSDQIAYVSQFAHEKRTSGEFKKVVRDLYAERENLDPIWKRSIEVTFKSLSKDEKLPGEFVAEITKAQAMGHEAWLDAKKNNDFERFKPLLIKMFELTKRYADYIDKNKPTYDVLLDDYEEGMTEEKLDPIFAELRVEIPGILSKIKKKESKEVYKKIHFDKYKLKDFLLEMTSKIGFDYERGSMGVVHHPFETALGNNDIRINISDYHENFLHSATGATHELGHGLYEQFVDKKYWETSLDNGVSLGIHESQSRFLENVIGRSTAFWSYFKNVLEKYFPEAKDISVEDIVNDLNIVEPSFIRIEADEVTYNLHILLRYEIETALLKGELKVDDLIDAWNSKMKDLMGIEPKTLAEGCLQDVHWSQGLIGYFPTYTLGNLNAAQLLNKFEKENPDWRLEVENGDFSSYFNFFKENIWQHGAMYKPMELMKMVTGEETNPKYLIDYLKNKYI